MHGHADVGDGDQDNYRQGREAGDRGADDGEDPAAVEEDADDAQDERKAQRPECGQPSKGWKNRASARPNQKHCQDNKPRHQREDEADRAEDGPFRFRRRNRCARFAAGSDIALSHGPCPFSRAADARCRAQIISADRRRRKKHITTTVMPVTGACRCVGARHASPDEAPHACGRGMPRPYVLIALATAALRQPPFSREI